jgi:hypothetical protein
MAVSPLRGPEAREAKAIPGSKASENWERVLLVRSNIAIRTVRPTYGTVCLHNVVTGPEFRIHCAALMNFRNESKGDHWEWLRTIGRSK